MCMKGLQNNMWDNVWRRIILLVSLDFIKFILKYYKKINIYNWLKNSYEFLQINLLIKICFSVENKINFSKYGIKKHFRMFDSEAIEHRHGTGRILSRSSSGKGLQGFGVLAFGSVIQFPVVAGMRLIGAQSVAIESFLLVGRHFAASIYVFNGWRLRKGCGTASTTPKWEWSEFTVSNKI